MQTLPAVEGRALVRYSPHQRSLGSLIRAQLNDLHAEGTGYDIWNGGICLLLTHEVEPDVLVTIQLEGISRVLLARVIRVLPQTAEGWLVTCDLIGKLNDEELSAIAGPPTD